MICDLLALRPISHITKKTLSYLHSTKIEQMTKTMVIFKRGAIFLCCIRYDPIPPQTSVQRLAHSRNVTTCCSLAAPRRWIVPDRRAERALCMPQHSMMCFCSFHRKNQKREVQRLPQSWSEQRVLFFMTIFRLVIPYTSLLPVYRCYWTYDKNHNII